MQFRTLFKVTEDINEDLFNAISIYMPKSLAAANLISGTYDPTAIDATHYGVVTVTTDNYRRILEETGSLMAQWLPVFNDGTNFDVTLYIVIFDDTSFSVTTGAASISWAPLSKAFNELYFISFFKTMFSEHYDGKVVTHDPAQAGDYDDSNFFDMSLCLAYLCEIEATLSCCLSEIHVEVFEKGASDTNVCKVMSQLRGTETSHCTTLVGSTLADRAQYYWGYLLLIAPCHTQLNLHNGSFMMPIILGKWFEKPNDSREYVGNKLAKIRLTGTKVKPTGLPSPLDSDVNLNLDPDIYEILDAQNVGYFISISNNSRNNAELVRDRTLEAGVVTAYMISKWIDYQTAQDCANYVTANETLTQPVLTNEKAYKDIQTMLVANIQRFTGTQRIVDIKLDFPPFEEARDGKTGIKGVGVWEATYVDDLETVKISGSITF